MKVCWEPFDPNIIIIYIKTGRDTGVRLNRHLTALSGVAQQERVSLRYEAPTSREQVVGSSPFWDTVRGVELADKLARCLPVIASEARKNSTYSVQTGQP